MDPSFGSIQLAKPVINEDDVQLDIDLDLQLSHPMWDSYKGGVYSKAVSSNLTQVSGEEKLI